MPDPVRIALFGNGFARKVMLPCLRRIPGIRLAGISSPNQARLRATASEFGIELAAADHREVLERAKPDLVFVVTPPDRHAEMAIDALSAGCHVICEKPMALTAEETSRMLAVSRLHPRQLALIDHELRFLPGRQILLELSSGGAFGRVLRADYKLHSRGRRDSALPWTWWSDRSRGGGALGALGSHAIDALRTLLGEISEVRGTLETFVTERMNPATGQMEQVTSDDFAAGWLRFRSGALGTMTLSTVEAERIHRIQLTGTTGAARVGEQEPLHATFHQGGGSGEEIWREIPVPDDLPESATLGIPDTDWARAFLRFAGLAIEAIRSGRSTLPGAATFADGHRTQQVLDALRRSARGEDWARVGQD